MAKCTEAYCAWFESLAPEVAKELAMLLMRLYPGGQLEPALATPNVTDGFVPRIRRLAGRTPFSDAGHALTLIALTDFLFRDRRDPAQWAEDRDRLELLDEFRAALGGAMDAEVAEWVAQTRLQYPLRAKLWVRAADSWGAVRQGPLSDEEIRAAIRAHSAH